ncbi:MAG: TIGR01212 family radical SAM protein [Prevotella sp.]|nr:TIGR01212 family radical SAM protein [Prevotella sp.]
MKYNDFGTWIRTRFPFRVQKISIDAGFSCPNRDGAVGLGGCTFCNNQTFSPGYCGGGKSIVRQMEEGKRFFSKKYPGMKYLAYFQSFTNTYGSLPSLISMYEEALAVQDVVGIVIGTRPDCVSKELLDYFAELGKRTFLIVEYGIESANDETLRKINRGHDFACSRKAVEETASRGILVGGHVIFGLPGEDKDEILRQAPLISSLPLNVLKIHQLQIVKGTRLAEEYRQSLFHLFTVEEYVSLIAEYIRMLRTDLVLERFVSQSPSNWLVAPKWGLKNYEFANLLDNYLKKNNYQQGDLYREQDGQFA